MATFPASIKNFLVLQDGVDRVLAQHPNERGDEITAIETLLGALGSSQSYSDSFKNLLKSYRRGGLVEYKSASDLYVRSGEITIPDASGNLRIRTNAADTTVTWSNLDTGSEASSTTYYVYAVADASGTGFTIKISTSASAPSGSTYYKRIGSFYNDGSSNIAQASLSNDADRLGLGSWESVASGVAATDLLVCAYVNTGTGMTLNMSSGGTTRQYAGPASDQSFCGMMPVKKGDSWSVVGHSACFAIPLSR